jgi:HSP20 family protein
MTRFVMRWDPAREMVTLRDAMNRLLEDSWVRPGQAFDREGDGGSAGPAMRLPIDAYSTADEVVIIAPVPGVKPEDVEITIEGDTLTVKGEFPAPIENVNYLMQERSYGRFARTVVFNVPVQADKAEANFTNGVLTISVPKAEAVRPRSIKVTTTQK